MTLYEARREAIRVERRLNQFHIEISKPLARESQRSTRTPIVETVANETNTNVEKPIHVSSQVDAATFNQLAKQIQDLFAQMIAL